MDLQNKYIYLFMLFKLCIEHIIYLCNKLMAHNSLSRVPLSPQGPWAFSRVPLGPQGLGRQALFGPHLGSKGHKPSRVWASPFQSLGLHGPALQRATGPWMAWAWAPLSLLQGSIWGTSPWPSSILCCGQGRSISSGRVFPNKLYLHPLYLVFFWK